MEAAFHVARSERDELGFKASGEVRLAITYAIEDGELLSICETEADFERATDQNLGPMLVPPEVAEAYGAVDAEPGDAE
ncbi:MAG: hypothetical protein OXH05_14475 [Acidobacteria bacterium]|nr:hypothetical protein [Acidobacteriota bacterium]